MYKARRVWFYQNFTHRSQILDSGRSVLDFLLNYPAYLNLGYLWNFGFALFVVLLVQIITGIFLSFHYVAYAEVSFNMVEHIMRDVNYGWLLRYTHANGASFFFLFVFIHISRALYYKSYEGYRRDTWFIGVILFFLLIVTAFTGYVLPWGQMSFWAATVVTNLFSAIPLLGTLVVEWLWGGFAVNAFTLIRIFSVHFILPFIILFLACLHVFYLHKFGGTNNMDLHYVSDKTRFSPYYLIKDSYFLVWLSLFFCVIIGFFPNFLLHPDNYIPADPLVTPAHIVPEWYFLLFYAMLRSIPSKLGGVFVLFLSIFILFILPYYSIYRQQIQTPVERGDQLESYKTFIKEEFGINWTITKIEFFLVYYYNSIVTGYKESKVKLYFWFFLVNSILLSYVGSQPVEAPFLGCGRLFTFGYFIYFIIIGFIAFRKWFWNNKKW